MKTATAVRTFDVLAMSISTATGLRLAEPRTETVTTENPLFAGATGPWDVEDRYLAFWNRLNDSWEQIQRTSKVIVISVVEVQ